MNISTPGDTLHLYTVMCVCKFLYVCVVYTHAQEYFNPILELEKANVFENNFPENGNFKAYMNSQIPE